MMHHEIHSLIQVKTLMREALFFELDSNVQGLTRRRPSYGRVRFGFRNAQRGYSWVGILSSTFFLLQLTCVKGKRKIWCTPCRFMADFLHVACITGNVPQALLFSLTLMYCRHC